MYILLMAVITCIGLGWVNLAFKGDSYKKAENKSNRIIIKQPKQANVPREQDAENNEGTRVTSPSTNGKPMSPVQPLPVPDPNALIAITPLS
jgi:hypothetical protein